MDKIVVYNVGLYCRLSLDDGLDNKNHVIRVKVVLYEKIKKMYQRYFFDGVEYDLGKVLMLMNEMKLVNNSKVVILGNDVLRKNNLEFTRQLLKEYVFTKN